jgi:4-amino-4-deoxy-L-arabinose transferase-like glycosyltransferase
MILLNSKKRLATLFIVLIFGVIIFILDLGTTGLVDETPPLFAAAARAMSESGDWLTPKVNGIFRFDKPPLIYWLMGFFIHYRKTKSGIASGLSQQDSLQLWHHYF